MKDFMSWCREHGREELLQCYLGAHNEIPPEKLGFSSGKRVEWKCRTCGGTWTAAPNKMTRRPAGRSVCPFCGHERPSPFYNAAVLYPELTAIWADELNGKGLEEYTPGSGYAANWRCAQGHTWTRPVYEQVEAVKRSRKDPAAEDALCPYCSHKRVSPTYNLEEVFPDVAREWCYRKNGDLSPRSVSPASQKKVFWECVYAGHVWQERISNRTLLLRGCPVCSRRFRISYTARAVYYYLYKNHVPCTLEVPVGRYTVDIEIPSPPRSRQPIALEIDGYSHTLPEAMARDAGKDRFLREKGYRVFRVKEDPLCEDGIRVEEDAIVYPRSDQYRWLDRVIQVLLETIAGVQAEPDHRRDHWRIEEEYYHVRRERSLAALFPKLRDEWSPKNKDSPETVSPGSQVKRWWICPVCGREYQASVYNRTRNHSGCPYCADLLVAPENSLAALYPGIAQEWDLEKNAPLRPEDVPPGANRRVWWRCKKGHEWQTPVYMRTGPKATGCPVCGGHTVSPETSLAAVSPHLVPYWNSEKNGLAPEQAAPFSNRSYWWRCPKGHEWQSPPNRMQRRSPDRICPDCSHSRPSAEYNLAAQNPALAALWHPTGNPCSPEEVTPYSNRKFRWRCEKGHEWCSSVSEMQTYPAERACPYCDCRRAGAGNSLADLAPALAAQWHPDKNLPLTAGGVFPWSSVRVWWRCEKGHEWQAAPAKRYRRGDGCPYCSGRRASPQNCLAARYPGIAGEWDDAGNAPLTPHDVTPGSGKRVWWICERGHRQQSTVAQRVKGGGCPVCRRERKQKDR